MDSIDEQTSIPQAVTNTSQKTPIIWILSSVALSLLFLLVGFFIGKKTTQPTLINMNNEAAPQVILSPTQKPVGTPVVTPKPLTQKKYKNAQYSFTYPTDWGVQDVSVNGNTTLMVAPLSVIEKLPKGNFGGGNFLTILIQSSTAKTYTQRKSDEYFSIQESAKKVGNQGVMEYVSIALQDMPGTQKGDRVLGDVFLQQNGYVEVQLLDQKYLDIFHQIVSSMEIL